MQKIISLFQRNYDGDRLVRDEVVPGAEWVLAGEGEPTRKWDGTCVKIEAGVMWKRYEVKKGKTPPPGFVPANDVDPNTGKQQGWLPVSDGPEDRWYREALENNDCTASDFRDGTYELVGPKVQGNPDSFTEHTLVSHGSSWLNDGSWPYQIPRTYDGIKQWLSENDIEGIVWHHKDGRMVKIKAKDFGIRRGQVAR
jgi:hypothetical protein